MEIDRRLPQKVERQFGHLMVDNTTLSDIQNEIFQKVPIMIKELDEVELKSMPVEELATNLAAVSVGNQVNFRRSQAERGRGRGMFRGNFRGSFRGRGTGFQRPSQPPGGGSQVYCKVCHIAGKAAWVCRSHSIGDCWALSRQDKQLLGATNAQSYVVEDNVEGHPEDPDQPLGEVLVPG